MKLTRREAQLVSHARRSAIANREKYFQIKVQMNGMTMFASTIAELKALNQLSGLDYKNTVVIELSPVWRK